MLCRGVVVVVTLHSRVGGVVVLFLLVGAVFLFLLLRNPVVVALAALLEFGGTLSIF